MPGLTLREIANQMYQSLSQREHGSCHHPCGHGLNIVLQRVGDAWLLKLARLNVYPSDLEVTLCKRAYRLADDHPDARLDPTADGWHVVGIRWQGAVPAEKRIIV
jgi:hypothetical protein